jgi:hypothetical protein
MKVGTVNLAMETLPEVLFTRHTLRRMGFHYPTPIRAHSRASRTTRRKCLLPGPWQHSQATISTISLKWVLIVRCLMNQRTYYIRHLPPSSTPGSRHEYSAPSMMMMTTTMMMSTNHPRRRNHRWQVRRTDVQCWATQHPPSYLTSLRHHDAVLTKTVVVTVDKLVFVFLSQAIWTTLEPTTTEDLPPNTNAFKLTTSLTPPVASYP